MVQMARLVAYLSDLGFTLYRKKSAPLPFQMITYLGVVLDSSRWIALNHEAPGPHVASLRGGSPGPPAH